MAGLVALANSGNPQALTALFDVGIPSVDPPRAPMALGAGTVAIRNTPLVLSFLESYQDPDAAIELIAEGFDMLEEDYEEERFFVAVRRGYWQAAESSPTRASDRRSSRSSSSEPTNFMERMTYAGSGVDYGALDPFKRRAQLAGRSTADVIRRLGVSEVEMSRGESAYLIETADALSRARRRGTRHEEPRRRRDVSPGSRTRSYYDHIAQDTVAMIVNDMITLGALPLAVAMHLGVGLLRLVRATSVAQRTSSTAGERRVSWRGARGAAERRRR